MNSARTLLYVQPMRVIEEIVSKFRCDANAYEMYYPLDFQWSTNPGQSNLLLQRCG